MIASHKVRAARGMLNWSQQDLADRAGVSLQAVRNYEDSAAHSRPSTVKAIQLAFEKSGVEFTKRGIQERDDLVTVYEDASGFAMFFDDVYETAKEGEQEFLVYGVDEKKFLEAHEKAGLGYRHRQRMGALETIHYRIIVSDDDPNIYSADYAEYRSVPAESVSLDVPFYIYGQKMAIILWDNNPRIIVLSDAKLIDAYKKQFEFAWNYGKQTKGKK